MNKFALTALFTCSTLFASAAFAATNTGTLTVKANVVAGCQVTTTATGTTDNATLDFGTVSSLTANVDADTTTTGSKSIGVLCNNGTGWSLAADSGAHAAAAQRRMQGPTATDVLPYNLYKDTTRATPIVSGTAFATGTGNGTVQPVNVYGRIPAGTALPAVGAYTDVVQLTVTY